MQVATLPTQMTAAITDVLLMAFLLAAAMVLLRFRRVDAWKAGLWSSVMIGGAIATALGAVTHGFVLSVSLHALLWSWIHLIIWIVTALFAAATLHDRYGPATVRRALPVMIGVAVALFGLNRLRGSPLGTVIAFESVVLTAALSVYTILGVRDGMHGALSIAAGIALTSIAAIMQGAGLGSFRFIWQFDPNGTYHLIQLVGLILMIRGVRASLLTHGARTPGRAVPAASRQPFSGATSWWPARDLDGGPNA